MIADIAIEPSLTLVPVMHALIIIACAFLCVWRLLSWVMLPCGLQERNACNWIVALPWCTGDHVFAFYPEENDNGNKSLQTKVCVPLSHDFRFTLRRWCSFIFRLYCPWFCGFCPFWFFSHLTSLGRLWIGMDGVAQLSSGAFICSQPTSLVFTSSSLSNNTLACAGTHTHMRTHTFTYSNTRARAHASTHIHTHKYIDTHTRTHTHRHTQTHTFKQTCAYWY